MAETVCIANKGARGEAKKVFDAKKRMICVVKLDWAEKKEGCSSRIFFVGIIGLGSSREGLGLRDEAIEQ